MRAMLVTMLEHQRPELWEAWRAEGTLFPNLDRLALIASDIWSEQASAPSSTFPPLGSHLSDPQLRSLCQRTVWLATEDDWEAASMALEEGDETWLPPSPPSSWYSISTAATETRPPTNG